MIPAPPASSAPSASRAWLRCAGAILFACAACAAVTACGGSSGPSDRPRTFGGARPRTFGGARPVTLQIPSPFDEGRDYPLVLVLHGYGANGFVQQAYFGAGDLAARGEAFVVAPDGTLDPGGRLFWNADSVCCDFSHLAPDDVAYLGGLIEDIAASWPVDRGAVFTLGHSNGGFMAYRLACERPDLFAAILSLAGDAVALPCAPSRPVSVLHVHGTADDTIPYAGAAPSVTQWAGLDGCGGPRAPGASLDLEVGLAGAETRTEATGGCPPGVGVDLWTLEGAGHVPSLGPSFLPTAWQWLTDRRR